MNGWMYRRFLLLQALAALSCFAAEGVCFFLLHLHYPYDCPVFVLKGDFFPDFILLIDRLFVHFHTRAFFAPGDRHFMYPPAAALLYEPFALLPAHRVMTYVALMLCTVVLIAGLFARALTQRGVPPLRAGLFTASGVALSYPSTLR